MLFPRPVLDKIVVGEVDLAFRRWRKRGAVPCGTQRTAVGVIAIDTVATVAERDITAAEAHRAGFATRRELLDMLRKKTNGRIYRMNVRYAGADGRIELRERADLTPGELAELAQRLSDMDSRSKRAPWTREYLELIAARPAELAADLARIVGRERLPFKADVRRLKELGLTESLEVGYRLSPRGQVVLEHLRAQGEE